MKHAVAVGLSFASALLFGTAQSFASPTVQPDQAAPVWQGFYIGGYGGAAHLSADELFSLRTAAVGAFAGYNHHIDRLVIGLEAGLGVPLNRFNRQRVIDLTTVTSSTDTRRVSSDWTLRFHGRLGWATGNLLLYVSGGAVVTQQRYSETNRISFVGAHDILTVVGASNRTMVGLSVGAGMEYALTEHWRVRLEYVYDGFGDRGYNRSTGARGGAIIVAVGVDPLKQLTSAHTAQLGVSYRF